MMLKIDFEAKTDRELLLLVAQSSNETVDHLARLNNTILKHEKRLSKLEATPSCESTKSRWKPNWQTITLIASIVALIVVGIGTRVNWW